MLDIFSTNIKGWKTSVKSPRVTTMPRLLGDQVPGFSRLFHGLYAQPQQQAAMQGTVSDLWNTVVIPISHMSSLQKNTTSMAALASVKTLWPVMAHS